MSQANANRYSNSYLGCNLELDPKCTNKVSENANNNNKKKGNGISSFVIISLMIIIKISLVGNQTKWSNGGAKKKEEKQS